MSPTKTQRISPYTDFGFKYIFGQEDSKDLLIDLLNTLLKDEPGFETIEDVEYKDKELPRSPESKRGVIYDIRCTTTSGKHFIVEMQNAQQNFFVNRSIYYAARSITSQGNPGKFWNFELNPVYVVAFLNFEMEALGENVRTDVALCDMDTHKPISDKIRFIYIQLPLFTKTEEECENIFDYWLYNFKHMETMNSIAFTQQHEIFQRLESVTNYANLNEAERNAYDEDLKIFRDFENCMQFSHDKGRAEGRVEGRAEGRAEGIAEGIEKGIAEGIAKGQLEESIRIAKRMLSKGLSIENVSEITGLSMQDINRCLN